jgi:membrane dipeptidase
LLKRSAAVNTALRNNQEKPVSSLHKNSIVVDGLVVSKFDRSVFEDMRAGGITAANCTCCVWEEFTETAANVARWKRMLRENSDILTQVYSVDDIGRAKTEGKVGIILGWQNSSGYGDNLDNVALFAELGVRIVQLTYNTANSVGCGCYETKDGGLTDFGKDLVSAMNASGVLVDLSHVGPNTTRDAISHSKKRVAYSHCAPAGLINHPRNKTDDQLKAMAKAGGFIGVTMFPAFLAKGAKSNVDDFVDAIEYVLNLAGEEQVGVGTDMTQGHDAEFFRWITHDKGHGRKLVDFGDKLELKGFERLGHFSNLTASMERRGWKSDRIERVLGKNWVRLLGDVWG